MAYELYEGEMAKIFDIMYQKFIDYDAEFNFYNELLKKYNCNSVLEIGSGTGNLANRFSLLSSINYQGMDYSLDMIKIAEEKSSNIKFIHGDMRNFKLEKKVDAIIMTGRTSSYIISNKDLYNTLDSISSNLNKKGFYIFDFIDASRYIPHILENKNIQHIANAEDTIYSRIGNWTPLEEDNFLLQWEADYYVTLNNKKKHLKKDISIVRVFTLDEIELFLKIKGFSIIEIIDKRTYAYDTFVIVATK
ncbi:class I SAM-dependent methyltransferase [Flavobacterium sp. H122]|uniref:class I SAM-dependent DNA methyltransferase n=1 Tax=Flavobacterium sp. H122 TaxID=2529860 RepID=UPI0010AAD7EF|nr:class I SAM-dependent methyltransferase [Flavobacterium sp. H122]